MVDAFDYLNGIGSSQLLDREDDRWIEALRCYIVHEVFVVLEAVEGISNVFDLQKSTILVFEDQLIVSGSLEKLAVNVDRVVVSLPKERACRNVDVSCL